MPPQAVQLVVVRVEAELVSVAGLQAAKVGHGGRDLLHQHEVAVVQLARRVADDVDHVSLLAQRRRRTFGEAFEAAVQVAVDSGEKYLHRPSPAWNPR